MKQPYIPKELINIILEYDGRIKYRNGVYIDKINIDDYRYKIINPIIIYKIESIKNIEIKDSKFYLVFYFVNVKYMGICHDYNWSNKNTFEICLTTYNHDTGIKQIRTIIS